MKNFQNMLNGHGNGRGGRGWGHLKGSCPGPERFLLGVCAALVFALAANAAEICSTRYQDGNSGNPPAVKLRWTAPAGELPGTLEEYLALHDLVPALFTRITQDELGSDSRVRPARATQQNRGFHSISIPVPTASISLLVDDDLFPGIVDALAELRLALLQDGYVVRMTRLSGGAQEEIKEWILSEYGSGSCGVVMIGDITAAWAEVSGDEFPCDLYYMDLDGFWWDGDGDGDYEIHNAGGGDMGPELFVARIHAGTLSYADEDVLVNGYLRKVLDFREGSLVRPWRALEYIDKDWYSMEVHLEDIYADSLTHLDLGYFTTAQGYLDSMSAGYDFVQVCAHSYSGGHHFDIYPTECAVYAHVYVHSPSSRDVQIHLGADDGIRVLLNGGIICTQDTYQGWQEDQWTYPATLDAGWNRLLCKISQAGNEYCFSARFTDPEGEPFNDLSCQGLNPAEHGMESRFITGWLMNGFHYDDPGLFWGFLDSNYVGIPEGELDPEEGEEHGGCMWTGFGSDGDYVDLDEYTPGADYGVTYAFVRITAEDPVSCELRAGYNDGAAIWLNGEKILHDIRCGYYIRDMTVVPVQLLQGENRLLVKVADWVGAHGFSIRLCDADGCEIPGLTCNPAPQARRNIGVWLVNGPYMNEDRSTRLTEDYLGGEAWLEPDEGDPAPFGTWELAVDDSVPFDTGAWFSEDGGWIFSDTIQEEDPPAFFYNLFACGPGRFTDADYLAGAYIFNTTFGLISIASSKSGSMLVFEDFTIPLSEGKSFGQAYLEWFDAQAPFETWEKEWYYGMVLNGDPTLRLHND